MGGVSHINEGMQSLGYLEQYYAEYRGNPAAVPAEWREYFARFSNGNGNKVQLGPSFKARSLFDPAQSTPSNGEAFTSNLHSAGLNERLSQLISNYRFRGHIIANVNPLGMSTQVPRELELDYYGFSGSELDLLANLPGFPMETPLTVRELFQRLRDIYCRSIGVQFMHMDNLAARLWLQHRMEIPQSHTIPREQQLRILTRLTDAVVFEQFLRTKFPGAKTFSLEGCETLLPLLDLAIEKAGHQGVKTIIIGMGHRGRLNVLAHIVGKNPCEIFREFGDGEPDLWRGGET